MSLIQLQNGNFIVVDTVLLVPSLLSDINNLTNNGALIEAVIATHPFHTTYFPAFYKTFPNPPYYGTPRHLVVEPQIPWAGSMYDCANRQRWLPEIHMRIPRGSEFVNPQPPESNHFSGIHVFHPASKTIHVDDTIIYDLPQAGDMSLHPSLTTVGLFHIPQSPGAFNQWVENYIKAWDFDNICAAHAGNKLGSAKGQLQMVLNTYYSIFESLTEQYGIFPNATDLQLFQEMEAHESNCIE